MMTIWYLICVCGQFVPHTCSYSDKVINVLTGWYKSATDILTYSQCHIIILINNFDLNLYLLSLCTHSTTTYLYVVASRSPHSCHLLLLLRLQIIVLLPTCYHHNTNNNMKIVVDIYWKKKNIRIKYQIILVVVVDYQVSQQYCRFLLLGCTGGI